MSRGVAVSAASDVFKVYKYMIQRLGDITEPIYLGSMWSGFPTLVLLWFLGSQGFLLFPVLRLFSGFLLTLLSLVC